jgi:hypothetical protein
MFNDINIILLLEHYYYLTELMGGNNAERRRNRAKDAVEWADSVLEPMGNVCARTAVKQALTNAACRAHESSARNAEP